MPKKSKPTVQRVVTRRQLARWRLERRRRLITLAIGLSIIGVVAGILAYGYLATYYIPPRQAAVRVNSRVFNMAYVANLLRVTSGGGGTAAASMADGMPRITQDNELVRLGAEAEGVTASDQEVDEEVRKLFQPLLPTPEEEPDEAKREAEFQKLYSSYLKNQMKVSDKFFREVMATDILRDKLRDKLTPKTAEQAHVMVILVNSLDKAKEAKAKLDAGEDFAALVKEYSEHSTKEEGGDLGWIPRGIQDPKLDEVAFSLEPGQVSEPFRTTLGFWVIKTVEKEPNKELSEDNWRSLRLRVLDDWLGQQRQRNRVESYWSPAKRQWLQNQFKA